MDPMGIFFDIFWRVAKNRERKKRPLLAHNQYAFPGVRVCKIGGAIFRGAPRHHEYNHACPARQGEIDKIFNPAIS
jgi:hypothetical protein